MDCYLVSFKMGSEESKHVSEWLRSCPKWARLFDGLWIVRSEKSVSEIRDSISQAADGEGQVVVFRVNGDAWGTYAIEKVVTDWMKENI